MKRNKRRLLIPQFEFGFVPETFKLFSETTLDGERITRELTEAEYAKQLAKSAQTALPMSPPTNHRRSFRLRAGDVIRFENKDCPVVRVNDCAAVVAVARKPREFTTRFDKRVKIQPKPALVHISPESEVQILNR